ncbi:hypothetical protein BB561_000790 [Smittium simulii]|uniref:Metal resistance protein YCF1 n=1 Tax=Smittium simulii TaxID=133385 RepID=A0A2T9YXI2_9FUNG|nr:hypothetical protein BB561_000790 [Smittium simulii]
MPINQVDRIFLSFDVNDDTDTYKDYQGDKSVEESSNIFSTLTFSWIYSFIDQSINQSLRPNDLPQMPKSIQTKLLSRDFWNEWQKERSCSRNSLLLALMRTSGKWYAFAGFLKFLFDILQFCQPALLKQLLNFVQNYGKDGNKSLSVGIYYAFLMFSFSIVQTIILHQYFNIAILTGTAIRASLVTTIYKKTMLMSSKARIQYSTGDIVNRMSVDAQKIGDSSQFGHIIWSSPFQISLALYLLYQTLGWSSLVGLVIMIMAIPLNTVITKKMRSIQKRKMQNKDSRIRLVEESLQGIKILKLYAWEMPFMERIRSVRNNLELKTLKEFGLMFTLQTITILVVPFLVTISTFATYSIFDGVSKGPLDSKMIFVSVALFNLLRFPLNMLPSILTLLVDANVSLQRIRDYLTSEELIKDSVKRIKFNRDDIIPDQEKAITTDKSDKDFKKSIKANSIILVLVQSAEFWWEYEPSKFKPTLKNITFSVYHNELLAVVGKVGSGKSSLLTALLGEMYKTKGDALIKGKVAYASQQPWIMNATVRENILFGFKYDKEYYERVVYCCGLTQDFLALSFGDLTEIGERGINLSGGQKARLGLARAVYSRADVYLLDDPLAAVDSHVGAHIFKCVLGPNGILQSRARILVTNAIPYLSSCDSVLLLQDGVVVEQGLYEDLVSKKGLLFNLVRDFGKTRDDSANILTEVVETVRSDENLQNDLSHNNSETDLIYELPKYSELDLMISNNASSGSLSTKANLNILPRASIRSVRFDYSNQLDSQGNLVSEETSATGKVNRQIYIDYLKSCGVGSVALFLITIILSQGIMIFSITWLKNWANSNDKGEKYDSYYLSIYAILGVLSIIFGGCRAYVLLTQCNVKSATISHENMLKSVFRSPMSFFDTTPIGRILNRFSKDQTTIDEDLPQSFGAWLMSFLIMIFSFIAIILSLPPFIIVAIPVYFIYIRLQNIYLHVSRDVKRIDSTTRSPIYQHFQESLGGVSTIRAYGQTKRFEIENECRLDVNQKSIYLYLGLNRWIGIRLEIISSFIILSISCISFYFISKYSNSSFVDASVVGMTISFALSITQTLNWCIRMYCKVETDIIALERTGEYSNLKSEAPQFSSEIGAEVPEFNENWPAQGRVDFENYSTRYREELSPVLNGINVDINPGEKIGVVGRTGAGKSSFTLALFRLIEPTQGKIIIDGVDITKIGLYELRSKLSIIPQDPVLFSGTIRYNLYPFDEVETEYAPPKVSDEELWNALELTNLKNFVMSLDGGLDAKILMGGDNFSLGQKQLMCLARALIRKSQIIVLDEATAAIDPETDQVIQDMIRTVFKTNTIITIAHRLNTVMDSDRILVLADGKIVEFDSPANLLADRNSSFASFASEMGISN